MEVDVEGLADFEGLLGAGVDLDQLDGVEDAQVRGPGLQAQLAADAGEQGAGLEGDLHALVCHRWLAYIIVGNC